MAERMSITFLKDPAYLPGETFRLEVNGTVQGDIITPWGIDRTQRGFGHGAMANTAFGIGPSVPFGAGLFGLGLFGQGVRSFTALTVARFVSGDYSVKARSVDEFANAGDWSDAFTVEHRPDPPPPRTLTCSGNALSWTWSDP